jgi:hypothetical protein
LICATLRTSFRVSHMPDDNHMQQYAVSS